MMFKKKISFLLSVILALICIECKAQCVSQPSCEDLGYNQTVSDCTTDKVIKCPFDTSKVLCADNLTQEVDENPIVADVCVTVNNRNSLPGRLLFSDGKCSTNSKYEGGEILGVTGMTGDFVFWGGCKNLTYSEAAEFCNSHGGTLATVQHMRSHMQMVNASYKDIEIPFCPLETGRCYRLTATSCMRKTASSAYQTVTISATDKTPFYCAKQVGTVSSDSCDLVTGVTCAAGCAEYHPTCPTKCQTCNIPTCSAVPSGYNCDVNPVCTFSSPACGIACASCATVDCSSLLPATNCNSCYSYSIACGFCTMCYN